MPSKQTGDSIGQAHKADFQIKVGRGGGGVTCIKKLLDSVDFDRIVLPCHKLCEIGFFQASGEVLGNLGEESS